LTGGRGRDTFAFNTEFDGTFDRITDFSHKDDTISLENGVFTVLGLTGSLPNSAFYSGAGAHDASDRIIYNPATGALTYDADGTGPIAPVQFAVLGAGMSGIAANDFYVG
jgi:Ca2+-binding RTX toxin-like protein